MQSMQTAVDDVLAAGDVCMAYNVAAGRNLRVEHWGDALTQGEIAGRTAAGTEARWDQVPGFWSTIGERTLKYAAWGDGYEQSRFEQRLRWVVRRLVRAQRADRGRTHPRGRRRL